MRYLLALGWRGDGSIVRPQACACSCTYSGPFGLNHRVMNMCGMYKSSRQRMTFPQLKNDRMDLPLRRHLNEVDSYDIFAGAALDRRYFRDTALTKDTPPDDF